MIKMVFLLTNQSSLSWPVIS